MPLTFAAVMPHGGALIPDLDDGVNGSKALTAAMRDVARSVAAAQLDVLIIANPHGLGAADAHSVTVTDSFAGSLGHLRMEVRSGRDLSDQVLSASADGKIPVAGVMVSTDGKPFPMDWGLFVPAWFIAEQAAVPPVVMIVPSRMYGLEQLADLGGAIANLAEGSSRRFGIIASADNAHAHLEEGPYGFHPSAKVFDDLIVALTRADDFEGYLTIDQDLMDQALPDSPWQLALLSGAFRVAPFTTVSCTYDCPSYFGMMVAEFARRP